MVTVRYEVDVPEGMAPGQTIGIQPVPGGDTYDAVIPEGLAPGERFAIEVQVPAAIAPAAPIASVGVQGCFFASAAQPTLAWQVGEFVSSGAYGGVFRCASSAGPAAGEHAVKVVRIPSGSDSERQLTQLKRELDIAAELHHHPNVVNWVETVIQPSGFEEIAIVMEFCGGGTLRDLLNARRGPLPEHEARQLFQQLIAGLAHCHKAWPGIGPICHRDLKPDNLLFGGPGNSVLKLADFGLGRGAAEPTTILPGPETKGVGTIAYMPPEVTKPDCASYSGCAADMWSAGVVLFVMVVTGNTLPFGTGRSGHEKETIARIRRRDFVVPIPPELSDSLSSLMDLLLQLEPRARPTAQTLHDLAAGGAGGGGAMDVDGGAAAAAAASLASLRWMAES